MYIGPSSKGRTTDFESVNRGSNPRGPSNFMEAWVSGCKPTALKAVCPQGHEGSNPSASANLNALVTELAYVLVLEAKFCGFDSHQAHQFMIGDI